MKSPKIRQEKQAIKQLLAEQQRLAKQRQEANERQKLLAKERQDSENTMPPLERVRLNARIIRYEQEASNGSAGNTLKTPTGSILLLLLLLVTALSLIAWGLRLMNG